MIDNWIVNGLNMIDDWKSITARTDREKILKNGRLPSLSYVRTKLVLFNGGKSVHSVQETNMGFDIRGLFNYFCNRGASRVIQCRRTTHISQPLRTQKKNPPPKARYFLIRYTLNFMTFYWAWSACVGELQVSTTLIPSPPPIAPVAI